MAQWLSPGEPFSTVRSGYRPAFLYWTQWLSMCISLLGAVIITGPISTRRSGYRRPFSTGHSGYRWAFLDSAQWLSPGQFLRGAVAIAGISLLGAVAIAGPLSTGWNCCRYVLTWFRFTRDRNFIYSERWYSIFSNMTLKTLNCITLFDTHWIPMGKTFFSNIKWLVPFIEMVLFVKGLLDAKPFDLEEQRIFRLVS